VGCRLTVPLAENILCYPFTYTALSLKIITTGQARTDLIRFLSELKHCNVEAFDRTKNDRFGTPVANRVVEVGKSDPTTQTKQVFSRLYFVSLHRSYNWPLALCYLAYPVFAVGS
jgi:hypothetical protein